MPRTPRDKLASFNIDPDKWEQFQSLCKEKNTSASAEILKFVDWVLAGNQLPQSEGSNLDYLNARLEAIEARLAVLEGVPSPPVQKKSQRKNGTLSLPSFPVIETELESSPTSYFLSSS